LLVHAAGWVSGGHPREIGHGKTPNVISGFGNPCNRTQNSLLFAKQFPDRLTRELLQKWLLCRRLLPLKSGARASTSQNSLLISLLAGKSRSETGFAWLQPPPPSLPKPATDSSLAESPLLRPKSARGSLQFPVSARRHRLQVPFEAPVSGGKNPVPNSNRAGLRFPVSARRHRLQAPFGRVSLRRAKSRSRQPIDDNGA